MRSQGYDGKCPVCDDNPRVKNLHYPKNLRLLFDTINGTYRGHAVDAVFIDQNKVSDSRLVIRFNTDVTHDWGVAYPLPKGFTFSTPSQERNRNDPVELVGRLPLGQSEKELRSDLEDALSSLMEWGKTVLQ